MSKFLHDDAGTDDDAAANDSAMTIPCHFLRKQPG